jgi:hypothetical protein
LPSLVSFISPEPDTNLKFIRSLSGALLGKKKNYIKKKFCLLTQFFFKSVSGNRKTFLPYFGQCITADIVGPTINFVLNFNLDKF